MKLATRIGMTNEDYILMLEAGFVLVVGGRIEEALEIFNACIELNPSLELPYVGISRCYSADGKLMRAEEWARKALQKRRSNFTKLNLAEVLLMQGKKEDAMKILERVDEGDLQDSSLKEWKRALTTIIRKDHRKPG